MFAIRPRIPFSLCRNRHDDNSMFDDTVTQHCSEDSSAISASAQAASSSTLFSCKYYHNGTRNSGSPIVRARLHRGGFVVRQHTESRKDTRREMQAGAGSGRTSALSCGTNELFRSLANPALQMQNRVERNSFDIPGRCSAFLLARCRRKSTAGSKPTPRKDFAICAHWSTTAPGR